MQPPFITSATLTQANGIRHGFFGRQGGVSEGIYASLNCGLGSNDNRAHIEENRRRVLAAMGGTTLHTVYQCHTANVAIVDKNSTPTAEPCDAMVTKTPGLVLGILTADCAPVLLADARAKVIGAAHAGWKGAVGGVLENTIAAMETLGATRENIVAAIGPSIAQASYEVGPEFVERLLEMDAGNMMFFVPSRRIGHSQFDLSGYVESRLQIAGITTIDTIARDTCAEEPEFFSYRRSRLHNEPDYGRQISAIALGNAAA